MLPEFHSVPNMDIAHRIQNEETKLIGEMKDLLRRMWNLQKEKKMAADGDLFDMDMVNPRCLPYLNSLLDQPNPTPNVKVTVLDDTHLSITSSPNNKLTDDSFSDWSGQWSSD